LKHVLHHDRDATAGLVDVFLDVGPSDFEFDEPQKSFINNAMASKALVGAVIRQFGGTTLFAHRVTTGTDDELTIVTSVLASLGRPAPVQVTTGGCKWHKR
jgi:hypothetical protein